VTAAPRLRVLTLLEYYLPGFKSGGALRTMVNTVGHLADAIDFRIVTADRDVNDDRAFPGVAVDAWNQVGPVQVFYASPRWAGALGPGGMRALVREVDPDVVWLNSLFAPMMARYLAWRRAGLLPDVPLVLAPRGELTPGALALKAAKKRAFLAAGRAAGLWNGVLWQASSDEEAGQIRAVAGDVPIHVAPDLPAADLAALPAPSPIPKVPGSARFVFLSRISPVKHLDMALEVLAQARGEIVLDIYGAVRDEAHWEACRRRIAALPPNVVATWRGEVPNEHVAATLAGYHFFVLPTRGENFGHAILEALLAGRPCLISDRTPWRGLVATGIGWDLPLEAPGRWHEAVAEAVAMDDATWRRASERARRHGLDWAARPELVAATRALFARATGAR
jgi:glycosyltransferase involved in cell wall biosynthesis